MFKERTFLLHVALLIVLICCSPLISGAQVNDTVAIAPASNSPTVVEISNADALEHAQRNLDRSLSILNIVATIMGVLVAVLTIVIAIVGLCGFFEINRWMKYREEAQKSSEEAKESTEKAKEAAEEVKPIIDRLKKAEEEIEPLRKKFEHFPSLSEPLSEEQKKILDDYGSRIEFLESFGLPLTFEDYMSRATDHYYKGAYELALIALDKVIDLKPDDASAWNNKGIALMKLERYEEALDACNKAIELKPDYASAWYNKACVYSLMGDKTNVLKSLSKAISLDAKYKEEAKSDEDFKNFWDDEDFQKLVS